MLPKRFLQQKKNFFIYISEQSRVHSCLCLFLLPVFNNQSKAGTRESPRPKAGTHGRDTTPLLPPPPPPPPPLLRERSERAEAREHAREMQALANSRGSANGLPLRRAEELRKQVLYITGRNVLRKYQTFTELSGGKGLLNNFP